MSAIDDKYAAEIKVNPWIGSPTTPEEICPDHVGHYRHYQGNASIYWTPTTNAHLVYGAIRGKWSQLGWERGPNGYPTTDEAEAQSGHGRFNNFQDGTIIWKTGAAAAFSVHGAIYGKWGQDGWDKGELGFPITDETGTPDGVGRYNHFENGSIYWTPQTGAHIVKGAIRALWEAQSWERGPLGYPLSDELVTDGTGGLGRTQNFQGGDVTWTPTGGAVLHLKLLTTTWKFNDFSAGKVSVSSNMLTFSNNGVWKWTANLHDSSTFYGDNYAIGFVFNKLGHGAATSGSLGATLSGPSVNGTINLGGKDSWLASAYTIATHDGATCNLHVSGDFGQLLDGLLSDLEKAGEAVLKALSEGNGGNGDDDDDDDDDDDGDGGDDEEAIRTRILSTKINPNIKLDPKPVPASASAVSVIAS